MSDCQRVECGGSSGCVGHCWKKKRPAQQPEHSHSDLQLAEQIMSDCGCSTNNQRLLERISERLAKHRPAQQQEPVAWRTKNATPPGGYVLFQQYPKAVAELGGEIEPLYTSPPASKPLTDEQRRETINRAWNDYLRGEGDDSFSWYLSQAIEAAHGIKGEA